MYRGVVMWRTINIRVTVVSVRLVEGYVRVYYILWIYLQGIDCILFLIKKKQ